MKKCNYCFEEFSPATNKKYCSAKCREAAFVISIRTQEPNHTINMDGEIWVDINGVNGKYQVSNMGRVQSFYKMIGHETRWRLLVAHPDKKGYLRIGIQIGDKKVTQKVHRLVAQHFISNVDNKEQVNHKDFNKANNHVDNLEWVTNSENQKHSYGNNSERHIMKGEENYFSKLKETDIVEIFKLKKEGYSGEYLGNKYNILTKHVFNILRREAWKHVEISPEYLYIKRKSKKRKQ